MKRVDLWYHVKTKRGGRTYHRTTSYTHVLDELYMHLVKVSRGIQRYRPNLQWYTVDCPDFDTELHVDLRR